MFQKKTILHTFEKGLNGTRNIYAECTPDKRTVSVAIKKPN
jgi:hypothetical protein